MLTARLLKDAMAAMGQIPTRSLGLEFAGVVMRCGSGCTRIQPGMRVAIPKKPSLTTHVVLYERRCEEVPDDMDTAAAASLPLVYQTAYVALIKQARLQRGETLLVHAAAGGVGQAILQMAQWIGAEIYASVGSNEKRQLLIDHYGIPAERIFSSRDLSFATGIMRATQGRGVDVIVNSLSAEALRASWECIAAFGRFIELGKRDMLNNAGLDMAPFLRQATFSSVNMETYEEIDHDGFLNIWRQVWDLVKQGIIKPVFPITKFPIAEAEKAIRLVASGAHAGKVVLTAEGDAGDDVVPITSPEPKALKLDATATYILCGGLGGIGRVIARFLANHGAKHLVLLSRSGATQSVHHSLLKDLEEQAVRVTIYKCDVSNAVAVSNFMQHCDDNNWRVKGLVQCAMVLRDRMFENMTFEDWNEATKAKNHGTKLLSDSLPNDVDFFIMLWVNTMKSLLIRVR
jgi:NADPH:quinone reductase-like Zn-dependent oxidoreductase